MDRLILLLCSALAFAELAGSDAPQLVSLKVHPAAIRPGDEVTVTWVMRGIVAADLSWQPTHALDGQLESRIVMEPRGSMKVRLFESTVFTLACRYPASYCSQTLSATVEVGRRRT
jgi:hypothetical protein